MAVRGFGAGVAAALFACAGPELEQVVTVDGASERAPSKPLVASEAAPEFGPVEPAPVEATPRQNLDPSMLTELRSVTLRRGACLGTCPIYALTVTRRGEVRWQGGLFVPVLGEETHEIEAEAAAALFLEILSFDYTHAPGWYGDNTCEAWGHDTPWDNIELDFGDRKHVIPVDTRCIGNPVLADLRALEDRIDAVAGAERWLDSPPRECVKYLLSRGLSTWDLQVQFERMRDDLVELLAQLPDYRLVIHTTASLRDRPGAARARAEAFVDRLAAAGLDRSRVDIIDEGTDLADEPADGEHVGRDERLIFRFDRDPCPPP